MSSDEGEIVEAKGADLKASSLPRTEGSSVDRRDRLHNRDSPDRDARGSSPRGYKRSRDDYDARRRRDTRSDRASRDDYKRSRVSYDDLDRSRRDVDGDPHRRDRYDERDRRHRSRSPAHRSRHDDRGGSGRSGRDGRRSSPGRRSGLDYDDYRDSTMASSASRQSTGASVPAANGDAKSRKNSSTGTARTEPAHKSVHFAEFDSSGMLTSSRESADADYDYDNQEQFDEEAEIERRRKRREALLAKSSSATPLLLQAVGATEKVRAASPAISDGTLDSEAPQTPQSSKLQLVQPPTLRWHLT